MADWDVVVVGAVPLEGSRALGDWQMARALARHHHVLYVDPPVFPRTVLRTRDVRLLRAATRQLSDNLWVLRPLATPGGNRRWGSTFADWVVGTQVRHALRGRRSRRIVVTFDPKRGTLPFVSRDKLVYWRRDRLAASEATTHGEHIAHRDRQLMLRADLVTGVSQPLVDEALAVGAAAQLIANGCDFEHFSTPTPGPPDLPSNRPLIGFAGGVSWRLDQQLIGDIVRARPDWTFVFVGEVVTALPDYPNLHVVGPRPYSELPGWVQRFDVGIIPYRLSSFNIAAAPLKAYEYLASGVPVVATSMPALAGQHPYIRLSDNARGFLEAVEDALSAGPSPGHCQQVALDHDWSARVRLLETRVGALLS